MKTKAFIFVILAGVLWGTSGIFVTQLSPYGFTSMHMTAMRGVVSFICMAVFMLFYDRKLFITTPKDLVLSIFAGVSLFLTATFYYEAMQRIGIASAVVIMYISPVFVMIASSVLFKEKMFAKKWIAVAVMILGCLLSSGFIAGIEWDFSLFAPTFDFTLDFWGIALALMSSLTYSAYNIITKYLAKRGCNPTTATLYCFLVVSVISLALCNPAQAVKAFAVNPPITIALAVGLGVFTFVLPYLFYTIGMKTLTAGTASA